MFRSGRVASARGVDEARHTLSQVFLPVDFPAAGTADTIDLTLNAVVVGRTTCGFMRFGDAVLIETAEAEHYHVDIPTTRRARMQAALSAPVYGTTQTAAVFMPGRPVTLDCSERFSQLSLMFPRDQLVLELEHLIGEPVARRLEFRAELPLAGSGGQSMLQAVRMIDRAAAQADGPLTHPLAAQRLEEMLIHSLLFGQSHNYTDRLTVPSPSPGARPVTRAVELLRSDPGRPWTVAELAEEVSASVRSLQEGFSRSLGTTPMAYLRRLRLEETRRDLSEAVPGTVSVTEVASRWGFVHLGRFAAAYARAFGERPSETLRR
ncbi:AraC family transcriptional regulator [Leifsonia sp. C5G2]|nr:AraC family transcriptional regulator [Leifsonia sp. C5G2]NUU07869.1 AraC family transcriptional regulator [Leifsonia sp. C5G2]